MSKKYISTPYIIWMLLFIFAPLCLVVYFAFTDKNGSFTIENISRLSQYSTVFMRSILLAAVATIFCLIFAYPVSYFLSRLRASRRKIMLMIKATDWGIRFCTTNCKRIAAPIPVPINRPVYRLPAKYMAVL